jgi:plastocyanin
MRAALVPIVVVFIGCSSSSSSPSGTTDGGGADSGGADSAVDSGGGMTVQGCGPSDYTDATPAAAMRTISFPTDATPMQFNPHCLKIKAGQSVTWNGSFTNHPLEAMGGDMGNPITPTGMGTTVTFAFATAGTFGFDCANHPSIMKGAIQVIP